MLIAASERIGHVTLVACHVSNSVTIVYFVTEILDNNLHLGQILPLPQQGI